MCTVADILHMGIRSYSSGYICSNVNFFFYVQIKMPDAKKSPYNYLHLYEYKKWSDSKNFLKREYRSSKNTPVLGLLTLTFHLTSNQSNMLV